MITDINYRLGYLDGQIKGVDLKADLLKIATEIKVKKSSKYKSNNKKSQNSSFDFCQLFG